MRFAHVGWNLGGLAFPLVVALLSIPLTLAHLGDERFGYLSLAWVLIGYATTLDLGIGRAVTHRVAALRATAGNDPGAIATVVHTGTRMAWVTGILAANIGGLALILLALPRVASGAVPRPELLAAGAIVGCALPLQTVSASYRGVNEAYLNFRGISMVRIALGVANFGVPCVLSFFTVKLYWLALCLTASRLLAFAVYWQLASRCVGREALARARFDRTVARQLMGFGGWFTVSSIANSAVSMSDRFLIASLLSVASVSLYFVPYELVAQSLIVVGAMTTVAFPYLTALRQSGQPGQVLRKYLAWTGIAVAAMAVVAACIWLAGAWALELWLASQYRPIHFEIAKCLALALPMYALGTMTISLLHAHGLTKATAALNLVEMPVYLLTAALCIQAFGVIGAAYAWALRTSANALALCAIAFFKLRGPHPGAKAVRAWLIGS